MSKFIKYIKSYFWYYFLGGRKMIKRLEQSDRDVVLL